MSVCEWASGNVSVLCWFAVDVGDVPLVLLTCYYNES